MMQKKLVFILLFFILQGLYVFAALLATFTYADMLPRIINTILFWFIFPVVGFLVIGFVGEKLLNAMNIQLDSDAYYLPYAITAATLWIPMLVGVNTGIDEYFQMFRRGSVVIDNISTLPIHKNTGFIEIGNVTIRTKWSGIHLETTSVKTGDLVNTVTIGYSCAAVLGRDEAPDAAVGLWICDNAGALAKPDFRSDTVKGRVIHNQYDINFYSLAIKNAEKRHRIESRESPVLVSFTEKNYEQVLEENWIYVAIFFSVIFCVWIVFSSIIVAKMVPVVVSSINTRQP